MAEEFAKVGDVELCYETFGDQADEPMLLVAGLGAQMLSWDKQFCSLLAAEGFYVVRLDNRDSGKSSTFDVAVDLEAISEGDFRTVPYSLSDMANDLVGLMQVLYFRNAHVVGMSLGGMIAQQMAIDHPAKVRSLVSIMSTTGNPAVGQASEAARAALLASPADDSDEALLAMHVERSRVWMSPRYPLSEAQLRGGAEKRRERAVVKGGSMRQMAAILSAGDRTEALRKVNVPCLVIHGEDDPLINVSGGRATARALPEAQLMTFPGMGHDLPFKLWPDFIAAIAANARRAWTNLG